MNTITKQVTEVQLGTMAIELDEEKLLKLAEVCRDAEQTLGYLTEEMDRLIKMTDNFAGLESEVFPLLRTIYDVKNDYRILMTLNIKGKEVAHG